MRRAVRNGIGGILAVGLVLAFVVGRQRAQAATPAESCTLTFSGNAQLRDVPVARTEAQQSKGLAGLDAVGAGMLFSWDKPAPRVFWMHNTRVPLSIAFLSSDGQVFAIEDMQPNTDTYHLSGGPALDALELAQGGFVRHGIRVGSRLIRRECKAIAT
jgi:uncharacterized membrane protein (UPF0127 family)